MQLQKPVKRIFTSRSCIDTSLLASLVAGLITRCGSFGCDHGLKTFHAHILSPGKFTGEMPVSSVETRYLY